MEQVNSSNHFKSALSNLIKCNKDLINNLIILNKRAKDENKKYIGGVEVNEFFLCQLFDFYVEIKQIHEIFLKKIKKKLENEDQEKPTVRDFENIFNLKEKIEKISILDKSESSKTESGHLESLLKKIKTSARSKKNETRNSKKR